MWGGRGHRRGSLGSCLGNHYLDLAVTRWGSTPVWPGCCDRWVRQPRPHSEACSRIGTPWSATKWPLTCVPFDCATRRWWWPSTSPVGHRRCGGWRPSCSSGWPPAWATVWSPMSRSEWRLLGAVHLAGDPGWRHGVGEPHEALWLVELSRCGLVFRQARRPLRLAPRIRLRPSE